MPLLTIEQKVLGKPVTVSADLPDVIRSAQPDAHLRRMEVGMSDQPGQITVTVEKEGEPLVPPWSQVVRPAEPARLSVFLPLGCGLQPGDRVEWVLRDEVTGEVLTEQDAVSEVDLW